MRITCEELKDDFLARCRMMIRTTVGVSLNFDNKALNVSKNYIGVPNYEDVRRQAIKGETDTYSIHPGDVYMTPREMVTFLNTAWEKLHLTKCKAISDVLMSSETHSTQIESMIYEHDQLYISSVMIEELKASDPKFHKNRIDATSNSSRLFTIPEIAIKYGPPTIVSVVAHEFPPTTVGLVYPVSSRVCRPVSSNEITGLINLATNSRYNSGSLCRHRKIYFDDKLWDMLEIFHRNEVLKEGEKGRFWQSGGLFVSLGYIQHPKPITVDEILGVGKKSRVIECGYPHEISEVAAEIAVGGSGAK
jgi:hypothetical protein